MVSRIVMVFVCLGGGRVVMIGSWSWVIREVFCGRFVRFDVCFMFIGFYFVVRYLGFVDYRYNNFF